MWCELQPAGEARSEARKASVAKGGGGGGGAGIFEKKGILVGLGAAVAGLVAMVAFRPQFYEVRTHNFSEHSVHF
jgi:hypothetical protein